MCSGELFRMATVNAMISVEQIFSNDLVLVIFATVFKGQFALDGSFTDDDTFNGQLKINNQ